MSIRSKKKINETKGKRKKQYICVYVYQLACCEEQNEKKIENNNNRDV